MERHLNHTSFSSVLTRPGLSSSNHSLRVIGRHQYSLAFCATRIFVNSLPTELELELELIQTQMTQKPMLRAEVYARALRASQNRKEDTELES